MQWVAGDESRREVLQAAIVRLERDEGVSWLRTRQGRRRLGRLSLEGAGSAFLKHYPRPTRHRAREWWKRRLHLTTAEREWRTLVRLFAAGVRVPEPLAHVRLASGERVVLTAWIEGAPLGDALPDAPSLRRQRLEEVGALVRHLHAAGWVHRDLHRENVLLSEAGPVLIDLQAARCSTRLGARRRDLGRLDFSLRRILSLPDRMRLRAAALGARRPFDRKVRRALREIGLASLERGRIHAASRARRSLRPGRRARRMAMGRWTGLISRDADEAALRTALGDPVAATHVEIRRYAGRVGDVWRGSAARRAWAVAHALEASDVPCVRPLAFLERTRLGCPAESLLVLARTDEVCAGPDEQTALRYALVAQLREAGFRAPDLTGRHVVFGNDSGRTVASVTALEGLDLPARRPRR